MLTASTRCTRRATLLERFTVSWNVLEAVFAIGAGILAGSVALVSFGIDSSIEVLAAVAILWRLRTAGADASAHEEHHVEQRAITSSRRRSSCSLRTSPTRPSPR